MILVNKFQYHMNLSLQSFSQTSKDYQDSSFPGDFLDQDGNPLGGSSEIGDLINKITELKFYALPKIAAPTYELTFPLQEKKVKYRPFLVKEEKILILALESQDVKQITMAIKQVLSECIQTRGIKVEELPSFDIEYLFLNVRGKSVGEAIDLIVTCQDDGETEVPVKIYVDQVDVQFEEDHSPELKLDDSVVLKMKYPSLDQFIKNNFDFNEQ